MSMAALPLLPPLPRRDLRDGDGAVAVRFGKNRRGSSVVAVGFGKKSSRQRQHFFRGY
jgi:hypothetical protein